MCHCDVRDTPADLLPCWKVFSVGERSLPAFLAFPQGPEKNWRKERTWAVRSIARKTTSRMWFVGVMTIDAETPTSTITKVVSCIGSWFFLSSLQRRAARSVAKTSFNYRRSCRRLRSLLIGSKTVRSGTQRMKFFFTGFGAVGGLFPAATTAAKRYR